MNRWFVWLLVAFCLCTSSARADQARALTRPVPVRANTSIVLPPGKQLDVRLASSSPATRERMVAVLVSRLGMTRAEAGKAVGSGRLLLAPSVQRAVAQALLQELAGTGAAVTVEPQPPGTQGPVVATHFDVVLVDAGTNKIEAIKVVRTATGLGLAESKKLIDEVPSTIEHGVDFATAEALRKELTAIGATVEVRPLDGVAPSAGGGATPAAVTEVARVDVFLLSAGTSKIQVIKALRDNVPGLGLAEAKALADSAPAVVRADVERAEGQTLLDALTKAGGSAELRLPGTTTAVNLPPATPPPAAPPTPAPPTCFDVVLVAKGANSIGVVKAVREITGLGLKEAKDLVDAAPKTVLTCVSRDQAEGSRMHLTDAGASAEVQPSTR